MTMPGLHGDRVFALKDSATRKIASAKDPMLWRQLLKYSARLFGDGAMTVRIGSPSGNQYELLSEEVDASLSRELGRSIQHTSLGSGELLIDRVNPDSMVEGNDAKPEVEERPLARGAPEGTFFDFAPLHLMTTSTLYAMVGSRAPDITDAARFRPNLILDCPDASGAFAENAWVGRILRIGCELTVKIVTATPRCAVPTLEHHGLPSDPDVLRFLVRNNPVKIHGIGVRPCAGVYAQIIKIGTVRVGDGIAFVD